jgi:hypothetical protein
MIGPPTPPLAPPPTLGPAKFERNPPFHASALVRGPHSPLLYKGRIRDNYKIGTGGDGIRRNLYFLYNPSAITASYTLNTDVLAPANLAKATEIGLGVAQQSFSFTLLFNRMYEVAYDKSNKGVNVDVEALEAMLHFTSQQPSIQFIPLKFFFGAHWSVVGVVNSINLRYMMFSHEMVPTHCEVDLQVQRVGELDSAGVHHDKLKAARDEKASGSAHVGVAT